jgi:hypothetical protein
VTILPTCAGFLIRDRPSRARSRGPLTRSPDQFRPSLDTPYVRDVVKHIGPQQWGRRASTAATGRCVVGNTAARLHLAKRVSDQF